MPDEGASTAPASTADGRAAGAAPAGAPVEAEPVKTTGGSGRPPSTELATSRSPSFRPGVVIADKYVVERLIGEGGLGVVVAAKHAQLEQLVAIKYLRAKALSNATVTERFVREARLAAKIRSDHVARVYDVGMLPSGAPYMVMEYLSGMDLGRMLGSHRAAARVAGGRLRSSGLRRPRRGARRRGRALRHQAGEPLRDDWGEWSAPPQGPRLRHLVAHAGPRARRVGAGRRDYRGGRALRHARVHVSRAASSRRTRWISGPDIWAIGVVLHQLLSGRLPFDGETLRRLCSGHRQELPRLPVRRFAPTSRRRWPSPWSVASPRIRASASNARRRPSPRDRTLRDAWPRASSASARRCARWTPRTADARPRRSPTRLLTRALRAALRCRAASRTTRWVATTSSE